MNKNILLLAVGLLASPMAFATFIVTPTTDTATDFAGTFSVAGSTLATYFTPTTFDLLPATNSQFCTRPAQLIGYRNLAGQASFGGACAATPDNPFILFSYAGAQTFTDRSGMYNTNVDSTSIYFRLFNLQDTGGSDGTFSGDFCFSTSRTACAAPTSVPEPSTFALLSLGLAGLGLKRRKAN